MIQVKTITAYFAPTKGKTYITKANAIKAETRAIILNKHPIEKACYDSNCCGDPGYHIEYDEPERYKKMFRRLRRIVAKHVN